MEKAVEWLRKKGIARGETRAGRAASEGKIVALRRTRRQDGRARRAEQRDGLRRAQRGVRQTVERIADTLLASGAIDGAVASAEGSPLLAAKFGDAGRLADSLKQLTGTIGENIVLRRYARFGGGGAVGAYVHHNGKVGDAGRGDGRLR